MFCRVKYALYLLCLMSGLLAPLAFAAPRFKIEPPAKKIATDQSAELKILLDWPAVEGPYEINSLEPKLENLTLEDQNQSQETGATVSQTFRYQFKPVKPGTAVIYPFEISYRRTETEPWTPILVPEFRIKVFSSLPGKAALIGLALVAGLSAFIFAGYTLWKMRKAQADAKNVLPPDPKQRIYGKAEESIATFFSPKAKEKLTFWSNQLRTVVTTYYDVPPKHATAAEVLFFLKNQTLPAGEWNEVSRLFGELTEMQFSRQDIPAYDLDRMQKTLLQYIKGKIIIGNLKS